MCPLWVRLFNVPLVAFNKEGLSRIASAIGVPLRMDACTASTCDNLWGRTAFAKVLINVWAKGTLKREVEVVIPKLSGEGEDVVTVVVEYDWEPSQCSICKVFGHRDSGCVNGIPRKDNPQPIDKDGFQRQRKQHWKPTARKGNPPSPKSATLKSKDGSSSPVGVVSMGGGKQSQIQTEPIIKETKGQQKEGGASMSKPNSSGLGGGAFCTVNAGHTPCGKDGPPNRIPLKEKGPEMVKSVVNTFKHQLKPRRGIMISDDSTNRFSPLSSDDSSDEVDVSVIGKSNINGAGISGVKTSQGVVIDEGIVENISK